MLSVMRFTYETRVLKLIRENIVKCFFFDTGGFITRSFLRRIKSPFRAVSRVCEYYVINLAGILKMVGEQAMCMPTSPPKKRKFLKFENVLFVALYHGRKNRWTVNSTNVCIDKHKRKQLPLKPPALPRFFRHFKKSTQERHYIFVSVKLQKVNIRAKRYDASLLGKLRIISFNYTS